MANFFIGGKSLKIDFHERVSACCWIIIISYAPHDVYFARRVGPYHTDKV